MFVFVLDPIHIQISLTKTNICKILAFHVIRNFNPLKTKPRLLYLKTQFVPRCEHFSLRL